MHIVDAHLHFFTDKEHAEDYDPKILIDSGVIDKVWLLSINGLLAGTATDEENK